MKQLIPQVAPIILGSLGGLALLPLDTTPWFLFSLGYFYAMFFTHPILVGVWAGLGPGTPSVRLIGTAAWSLALMLSTLAFIGIQGGSADAETIGVIFLSFFAQWLIILPLLLVLAWQFRLGIRPASVSPAVSHRNAKQFGLSHLMVLMAGTAMLFGLGRAVLPAIAEFFDMETIAFLSFFGLANLASQVPLAMAPLLRRYATLAIVFAVLNITIVTAVEYSLMGVLEVPDLDLSLLLWVNGISSGLTLLIAGVLRLNGFLLVASAGQRATDPGSDEGPRSS